MIDPGAVPSRRARVRLDAGRAIVALLLFTSIPSLDARLQAQEPATAPQAPAAEEPGQVADPELGLEQILEKHLAARLPAESGTVQTVKATGTVGFQGMQLPMTMHFQRPKPFRVDIDLQGMTMVQAYDGTTAWTISPFQGIVEPEALGPEAEDAVTIFSDFLWGLLDDVEGKGISLTLVGIEKVGNDEAYRLEATLDSGKKRQIFLGGEDFLEHRLSFDAEFMGAEQTLVATLGDYRQVGVLLVPHRIVVSGAAMQIDMALQSVESGVELGEDFFGMPEPTPPPEATPEPAAEGTPPAEPPGRAGAVNGVQEEAA